MNALSSRGHSRLARRRWLLLPGLLLLAAAALSLSGWLGSNSEVGRARGYFRESFRAGTMTERMSAELERIPAPVAVAALTGLLREENSRLADAYEAFWNALPKGLQGHLPAPVNRMTMLLRTVQMLERYGGEAAPAVGELVRLYQSTGFNKGAVRSVVVTALGRIGPPARAAIPVLLPGLDPTNGFPQSTLTEALVQIDPGTGQIDSAWEALERGRPGLAANILTNCVCLLTPAPPGSVPTGSTSPWTPIQIMGLLQGEAPRSVPILRRHLSDSRERVRGAAAIALGRLGPAAREAVSDLRGLLTDDWRMVREASTNALRVIVEPAVPAIRPAGG